MTTTKNTTKSTTPNTTKRTTHEIDYNSLSEQIRQWGQQLGFQQVAFSDTDLRQQEKILAAWLDKNYHGTMAYMSAHGQKRSRPQQLVPGTLSIITTRMDYLPTEGDDEQVLQNENLAYISRYALGKDYHKLMRKRLKKLAQKIEQEIGSFGFRVFVDSAPVLERSLAEKSGLGWIGKNSLIINRAAGSWFFLGEIYTDLPLPADKPTSDHCGSCTRCIDTCPTKAIVNDKEVDARRCISYLTIEHKGSIAEEFRAAMGNRIYGCDDCQLVCPWNRYANLTQEHGFLPRHRLDQAKLLELWDWDEDTFLKNTEGSAIRRIGYQQWLRNLAIALGNGSYSTAIVQALQRKIDQQLCSDLVLEHITWALDQHMKRSKQIIESRNI